MNRAFGIPSRLLAFATLVVGLGMTRPALAADDEDSKSDDSKSDDSKSDDSESDDSKSDDSKDDDSKDGKKKDDAFGHGGQIGLRIGALAGYKMILRYDDSGPCTKVDPAKGENQQTFCGHAAPFALTPALSFGIADWLEPFAWGRFGLASEKEAYTEPVLMFGAGVRVYTMSDSAFKIFIEPGVGIELEDGMNGVDLENDFAIHLAAGPTLDFNRYLGIYATGGLTTTILRALSTSLELELGLQGRY